MDVTRRDLGRIGLAGAVAALSGCRPAVRAIVGDDLPEKLDAPAVSRSEPLRLANRLGFGPRPGDLAEIERIGSGEWIERQLAAEEKEPLALQMQLARLDTLRADSMELKDLPMAEVIRQLQQGQILRAVYSRNQLRERMADFWTNHFNIYARKSDGAFRKGPDDLHVVRKHAMGSFPAMLRASARSPAMLAYLDNDRNRDGVPNENYAREILELHTLGVDGGYSQRDIQELARCLSGWTIEDRFLRPKDRVRFDPERHDPGEKTVLGRTIPAGGGERDLDRVLDVLSNHPSTSKYLARKLAMYFLGERCERVEAESADAYVRTGGDIRAMLRPIATSKELVAGAPIVKRPFDYVVSALRAVDADTPANSAIQQHLRSMGQPGFEWPMPDGYPIETEAWTGSLLARWNFALAFVNDWLGEVRERIEPLRRRFSGTDEDFLASLFFGCQFEDPALRSLRAPVRDRLASGADGLRQAALLCMCSTHFQWR